MSTATQTRFGCPECGSKRIGHALEEYNLLEIVSWTGEGSPDSYGESQFSDVLGDFGFVCLDCESEFQEVERFTTPNEDL